MNPSTSHSETQETSTPITKSLRNLNESGPLELQLELLRHRCTGISDIDEEVIKRLVTEDKQSETVNADDLTLVPVDDDNDLIYKMIDYVIKDARLLFCHVALSWQQFSEDNPTAGESLSCEELRDFFITNVLTKIYTYTLPEATKKAFRILDISSSFQRIKQGYLLRPNLKYDTANMTLRRDVDYTVINVSDFADELTSVNERNETSPVSKKFKMDTQKKNPAKPHIVAVVGDGNALPQINPCTLPEVHALCSAAVALDYELFNNVCLPADFILKRLQKVKRVFEETGNLPDNVFPDKLKLKLKEMKNLRENIINVTNQRFS